MMELPSVITTVLYSKAYGLHISYRVLKVYFIGILFISIVSYNLSKYIGVNKE